MIAKPIVVAAGRWIRLLEQHAFHEAARLTRTSPSLADLTPGQYESGWELLAEWDLRQEGRVVLSPSAMERLLERYFFDANPLWLQAGEEFLSDVDLLPVDIDELAHELDLAPERALSVARRVVGKYDARRQAEIGLQGEQAFIDWLTQRSDATVEHTSLFDDHAGYDVRILKGSLEAHFEIKATTREGPSFRFFLSRNEFETMQTYASTWHLQLVRLTMEGEPQFYFLDSNWLTNVMPEDTPTISKWASAEIVVEGDQLSSGLHLDARWCLREHTKS